MKELSGYTGTDTLEVMQLAVNYNKFVGNLFLKKKFPTSIKVLDIGAGIGLYTDMFREKGYDVCCCEPDTYQSERLVKKGFKVYTSIDDVPDESFDFIYSFNVLEHIADDHEALVLWRNKLKRGGELLVYVPAFHILFSSMDRKVCHFRRYRRKSLTAKIKNAGMEPSSKARYADSIGFFVTLVYKLMNKKDGNINETGLFIYDRILFPVSRFFDLFLHRLLGKNVLIYAKRQDCV
ncbi:MAG: class I SAM-dependent methyltransferase [Tannerella sp.]|jgi:SAM-dependent methyltransferase|nr:class I SAM-dependent methyltransferase [Tannerella sp.]